MNIPRLKVVKLIPNEPMGYKFGNPDDHYVVLGEVGTTRHYVIMNLHTQKIIPMVHLESFEEVPEDEQ